jgi:hypothetical protein
VVVNAVLWVYSALCHGRAEKSSGLDARSTVIDTDSRVRLCVWRFTKGN